MSARTDSAGPEGAPAPSALRIMLRGGSLSLSAQAVPVLVGTVLTPLVIHGFGLARYGVLALTLSIVALVSAVDGGVAASAGRYFAVFAGTDDRASTGRYVLTLCTLLAGLGVLVTAAIWPLAPPLLASFHVPADLRAEGVVLLRVMGALVALGLIRGVLAGVLEARQRFGLTSATSIVSYLLFAGALAFVVTHDGDLRDVARIFVAQMAVSLVLIAWPSIRLLNLTEGWFCTRTELGEFLRYARQVQLVGLSTLVNLQADALIIGGLLGVRPVGLYSAGASFAAQLRTVPLNGVPPAAVRLAHTHAGGDPQQTREEFERLQRWWVLGTCGWVTVAASAAYFAIVAWLGPEFRTSGIVATVLLAGYGVNLLAGMLTRYLQVVGRPDLEARYAVVAVLLNLALTVPFALLFGLYGVVTATAAGMILGSLYLLHLAQARHDRALPSFLHDVPWRALPLTVLVVVGGELLLSSAVPHGAAGLLLCSVPAAVGLVFYACLVLGPCDVLYYAKLRR